MGRAVCVCVDRAVECVWVEGFLGGCGEGYTGVLICLLCMSLSGSLCYIFVGRFTCAFLEW